MDREGGPRVPDPVENSERKTKRRRMNQGFREERKKEIGGGGEGEGEGVGEENPGRA